VARHLELAQSLGAEVQSVTDDSLVRATARVAAKENVTKIVSGKPLERRWRDVLTGTVVDQILQKTSGVDIFVIGGEKSHEEPPNLESRSDTSPHPYLAALGMVAAVTGLGYPLISWLQPANKVMFYLATVVCAAYYLGRGPALLASLASVLAFNFFFVPPFYTLSVADPEYILTFLGLLLVGLLISSLTAKAKETAVAAQEREGQAVTLLSVSRDLSGALSESAIAKFASTHLERLYGPVKVLLASGKDLQPHQDLEADEFAVADWAFRKSEQAGSGTNTLPGGAYQWHPLLSGTHCLGVVGLQRDIHPGQTSKAQLLEAILSQVAASLERLRLAHSAQEADLLKATERLQTALLNSISHDLRIPLVSINGALSSLLDQDISLEENAQRQMIENALSEAGRLTRLVTNLLQMTRMESGVVEIRAVPCDPWDLVSTTLTAVKDRLEGREVHLNLPDDLPLVPMDYVLIQQVLTNLLENSARHGAGAVTIEARVTSQGVEFGVSDEGPGIDPALEEKIFERFFRVSEPGDGGAGLGLSICKGLVEAHGGRIWINNGREFRFVLPLEVT
jgi:two-component system sensor histidine kinase KdpD